MRFCPQIQDISGQCLYRAANIEVKQFSKLKAHFTKAINNQQVIASWDGILCLGEVGLRMNTLEAKFSVALSILVESIILLKWVLPMTNATLCFS
jgi:hypothetical protein